MKSIIVGTDFSKGSYVALELAVDIANKLGCGIKIIWAKREKLLIDEEQLTIMTHLAEEKLMMLCDQHKPNLKSGEMRWEICSGKVGAVISRQAQHENAPLIVIGTNGASGFEKYWMGSTAVRIVQEAPVPVLTVRQGYNFHKALERIVVPIDSTADTRQKVPHAARFAKLFGSELHILGLYTSESKSIKHIVDGYVRMVDTYLTKADVKHVVKCVDVPKNLTLTTLEYADEVDADMIAIMTEQESSLTSFLLGTYAQQILTMSHRPILSIRPEEVNGLAK